jgi:hypothetical protein
VSISLFLYEYHLTSLAASLSFGWTTEIYRAALILHKMANSERGAEGVRGKDGKEEMIDKPMVLQVSLTPLYLSFSIT